jgi:hypothetical protein
VACFANNCPQMRNSPGLAWGFQPLCPVPKLVFSRGGRSSAGSAPVNWSDVLRIAVKHLGMGNFRSVVVSQWGGLPLSFICIHFVCMIFWGVQWIRVDFVCGFCYRNRVSGALFWSPFVQRIIYGQIGSNGIRPQIGPNVIQILA